MGLHRVYHLIPKFIEYYPNLNTFMTSTNFTIPNWFDEFYGLTNILKNAIEHSKENSKIIIITINTSVFTKIFLKGKEREEDENE